MSKDSKSGNVKHLPFKNLKLPNFAKNDANNSRVFNVDTNLRIVIFLLASLLFSLELKTDSLMLADGVMIFLFNLLNISLLLKINDKTSNSSY